MGRPTGGPATTVRPGPGRKVMGIHGSTFPDLHLHSLGCVCTPRRCAQDLGNDDEPLAMVETVDSVGPEVRLRHHPLIAEVL